MLVRIHNDGRVYVIEAPASARVVPDQWGGLPCVSVERAHGVHSDAFCSHVPARQGARGLRLVRDPSTKACGGCSQPPPLTAQRSSHSSRLNPVISNALASSTGLSPVSVHQFVKLLSRLLLSLGLACPCPDSCCRRSPDLKSYTSGVLALPAMCRS